MHFYFFVIWYTFAALLEQINDGQTIFFTGALIKKLLIGWQACSQCSIENMQWHYFLDNDREKSDHVTEYVICHVSFLSCLLHFACNTGWKIVSQLNGHCQKAIRGSHTKKNHSVPLYYCTFASGPVGWWSLLDKKGNRI